jgi:nucleotide-binding universal stress UspA family protein
MEPFESAANFYEDVGLFQAAAHSPHVELPAVTLSAIHLAVDGSNQDATARGLAQALAARSGAKLAEQSGAATAADILAAAQSSGASLIVVPAPFGRDYAQLRDESLGSVIDQLLLEAPCPVLCVRGALDEARLPGTLDHVLVPFAAGDAGVPRALSWGFHLLRASSRLELIAVADRAVLEEARHLVPGELQAFTPERVTRAILTDIGSLVSAAQKRGTLDQQTVHVETRVGDFVQSVLAEVEQHPGLLICVNPRAHAAPAFHRAIDLLLSSRGPVLLV